MRFSMMMLSMAAFGAAGCADRTELRDAGWRAGRMAHVHVQTQLHAHSTHGYDWSSDRPRRFSDPELVRFSKDGRDFEVLLGPRGSQSGRAAHGRRRAAAEDDGVTVTLSDGFIYLPDEEPYVDTGYVQSAHVSSKRPAAAIGKMVVEIVDANTHRVFLLVDDHAVHSIKFFVGDELYDITADRDQYRDVVKRDDGSLEVLAEQVPDAAMRKRLRWIRLVADESGIK